MFQYLPAVVMQMEMDGEGAGTKSQFGGSNKRARTAAASQWDSQVFSDDEAEADVRTKLGAATLAGDARKARTAGMCLSSLCESIMVCLSPHLRICEQTEEATPLIFL